MVIPAILVDKDLQKQIDILEERITMLEEKNKKQQEAITKLEDILNTGIKKTKRI